MFAPVECDDLLESVSFFTLEKIEMLISRSSLDRDKMYRILKRIQFETDALDFHNYLRGNQLIPGLHFTPHTLAEQKKAIEYMVSKDDLHEIRYYKK